MCKNKALRRQLSMVLYKRANNAKAQCYVMQRQPFTGVTVKFQAHFNKPFLIGAGFSKVMHPDEWAPQKGVDIAKWRACKDVADKLLTMMVSDGEEHIDTFIEDLQRDFKAGFHDVPPRYP